MKYWVFQNNQVTGPFEPEDLPQTPGYSGETLICPEGRKGTNMGDWQRASNVPELATSILKASQLALAIKGGGYPALPPEPTLKDLAALGSLQEKVSLLDNTVAHLQESLRLKDEELLSLHKELEDKSRHAQDLALKLGGLEERLSAVNALREGLDKAVAAEHDVEATVQKQAQMIAELRGQLEVLSAEQKKAEEMRTEIAQLKQEQAAERGEIERTRADMDAKLAAVGEKDLAEIERTRRELEAKLSDAQAAAAAMGEKDLAEIERTRRDLEAKLAEAKAAAAAAGQKDMAEFERTRRDLEAKLAEARSAPPPQMERPAPLPSERPAPLPSERPAPLPAGPLDPISPFTAAPLPELTPLSSGVELGAPAFQPLSMPGAASAAPLGEAPAPASVVPETAPKAQPRSRSKATLMIVILLVGGGFAAWKLGTPAKKGGFDEKAAVPAPAPSVGAEAELEAQKKRAIDLVRAAAPSLDSAAAAAPGGLSPWFADKIRDGVFQVNYYPPKTGKGTQPQAYEFEASLADGSVSPHNDAAAGLLSGAAAAPVAGAKARGRGKGKVPIRAKGAALDSGPSLLDNPLSLDDSAAPEPAEPPAAAPAPRPAKAKKAKAPKPEAPPKDQSLDELLAPGPDDGASAPEEQPAPKRGKKGQPADAELLDDLLKP